ncbi:MAG: DUF4397 domain-containing protein [Bacteroidota bacterium]
MKKNSLQYFIPVAVILFAYACTKDKGVTNQPYDQYGTSVDGKAQLKVNLGYAYTVNSANALVKLNGTVVSGLLAGRTPFPGGGYNTNGSNFAIYINVPQGANTISVVIPKVGTNTDSVVLYTTPVTLPDAGPYTLHIADTVVSATVNNTKSVLVKNIVSDLDTGRTRYKFVNLIPNLPAVDLYLNGVLLKSAVNYLAATDTFSVRTGVNAPGFVSGSQPVLTVRPAGAAATSAAIATYTSTSILQSTLTLTIFSMGYSGSTGTRLPFVSLTLDKNQ